MGRKKLEKTFGFKLDDYESRRLSKIIVVGCGGNGSHLVPNLARLISTLNNDDKEYSIVLIDGDDVEEKNLIRQHFISTDIGMNKAEALAKRYSTAFNVDIGHVPEYLTKANLPDILGGGGSPQLFVTCTDNLKSRKLISEQSNHLWVDMGNEETSGQVTFSYMINRRWGTNYITNNSSFPVPHVFEIFPDYEKRAKKEKPIEELSCAEMAEAAPEQVGFVNATCATLAMNYIHALLTQRPIKNHMTYLSIDNAFEHRPMSESTVHRWIDEYPRFKNVSLA